MRTLDARSDHASFHKIWPTAITTGIVSHCLLQSHIVKGASYVKLNEITHNVKDSAGEA